MKKYSVQKSVIQQNVLYLSLMPVEPKEKFLFSPGQYATIGFTGANGRPSPMRCFSIVSAPDSPVLEFAIRIHGQFTEALSCLPLGSIVSIQGPFGEFIINPNISKGIILLAGGIGITPFISIIRATTQAQFPTPLTLLFGCKNQDDVPFLAELGKLMQQNPQLNIGFFIAEGPIDKLAGTHVYRGKINGEWLGRVTGSNYQNYVYYLCGPKGFMVGLTDTLTNKGVQNQSIFSESFSQTSKVQLNSKYSAKSLVYKATAWSMIAALFLITVTDLKQTLPKLISTQTPDLSAQSTASNNTIQSTPVDTYSTPSASTPSNSNSASSASTPAYNYSTPSASQYSGTYRSPRTAQS